MKICIIADVANEAGEVSTCAAVFDAELKWMPMNAGNAPIAANKLPNRLFEVEMKGDEPMLLKQQCIGMTIRTAA